MTPLTSNEDLDLTRPVEIADRLWWVGEHLGDDPFQCHVYLLEHDDQSVLFDPGGLLTFDTVWKKVTEVIEPEQLRWIVCHHQDPDITASLTRLDELVRRPDAAIVTHWRAEALMKHYALRLPFHLVDRNDWRLDLGGRELRFLFTPYLHFPGAFVTFDEATGTLLSSDLFGGFTQDERLIADSIEHFEDIRPFHEHYMPSREILVHGLEEIEELPLTLIAPQHGRLIPHALIAPIITALKNLDCGLYLMTRQDSDIRRLSAMHQLLRGTLQQLAVLRDFREIAAALENSARAVFPITSIEFWARDDDTMLRFSAADRFGGVPGTLPEQWAPLLHAHRADDDNGAGPSWVSAGTSTEPALALALFSPISNAPTGVTIMHLSRPVALHESTLATLAQISTPLEVALEREMLLRSVELERERFYGLAMRDPLTGLLNRLALKDSLSRLLALHDRGDIPGLVVTMFDIDHFKAVNDTHGHAVGDTVLTAVAKAIGDQIRPGDLAARLGGEEFAVFHVAGDDTPKTIAERIRQSVAALTFDEPGLSVTTSAGVAVRRPGEGYGAVLARADAALYDAKESGRDRTVLATA
ncbi:diguanylate cyclase domain-containing protein [Rhabdothermincola salaria]|uniref:diguanylate cyclase domain-containing protein n=1 Tax=Rhabdothermincola salaria TaxID=2903142 RepID=UPI001E2C7456|nr:diguanylate cyclase [Rhabdothermincola salaria]MCD9622241.1 diguanylate cyclase [Rhabdothermincola salaria]